MPREVSITQDYGSYIWDILVNECDARESGRDEFVYHMSDRFHSEYRFCGSLGFGGKFWRGTGWRMDGTYGELWYVNQYSEDEREGDAEKIARANKELGFLVLQWEKQR